MPQENEDFRLKNIEALMVRMDQKIDSIDARLRDLEKRDDTTQAELKLRIDELSRDVVSLKANFTSWMGERKTAMEKMGERVSNLEMWRSAVNVKITLVTWVAGIFGASLAGLIWAILTHAVEIVSK